MNLSGIRGMWILALFDLPVDTRSGRRAYVRFRRELLKDGFSMLQYSVYARYCVSEDSSSTHRARIRSAIPDEGQVRILALTDCQFEKMEVFKGKTCGSPECKPVQLEFF